jgi:hypothetical protein
MVSCPSDELLLGYGRNELTAEQAHAVSSHLLFCDTCVEYLKLLRSHELSPEATNVDPNRSNFESTRTEILNRFQSPQLKREAQPKSWDEFQTSGGVLRVGQIWRPKTNGIVIPGHDNSQSSSISELESSPHLVVIIDCTYTPVQSGDVAYHMIRVAPIDADLEYAVADDFIVRENDSPLGYSFLVQTWNEQLMLAENLECLLAELDESGHPTIFERLKSAGDGELAEGAFSLEAVIMKARYSDPVMRYRAKEYEDTAYLRIPVQSLQTSLVSYEGMEEFSDTTSESEVGSTVSASYISEIIRKTGISEMVWSSGWQPGAARAADSGRTSQRFHNSDQSLRATLRPVGKRMLLRIEGAVDKWEGAIVPFLWRSRDKDAGEFQCVLAVLSSEANGLSYAEIKLGGIDEIEHRGLPEAPFPAPDLTMEMADTIRTSIVHAVSNHELDAWYELTKQTDLDPRVRAVIEKEIKRN